MNLNSIKTDLANLGPDERKQFVTNIYNLIQNKKEVAESLQLENANLYSFFLDKLVFSSNMSELATLLDKLLKLDKHHTQQKQNKILQKEYDLFLDKRCKFLAATDWTQLPDVDLTRTDKETYRKYRKYLRNLPNLYEKKIVDKLVVLSYKDFINSYLFNLSI